MASSILSSHGSRSTPLTAAVAGNPTAHAIIATDERGAAFHALGYARATGNAAALICTSGTAAANYLPAIIEADADRLPLLVLSADRPPELRDSGANQTIVQPGMFANYVRQQVDMPCPRCRHRARVRPDDNRSGCTRHAANRRACTPQLHVPQTA